MQQKLVTGLWYHPLSSFTLAPKDKLNPMSSSHVEHNMGTTCTTCNVSHLSIRYLPCGFMDTWQEGWFNLQRQYMPLLWAACGLMHPFTLLARRCVHHLFDYWLTGSFPAANNTMCYSNVTKHQLYLSRYHVRNPHSHGHLRYIQYTPIQ